MAQSQDIAPHRFRAMSVEDSSESEDMEHASRPRSTADRHIEDEDMEDSEDDQEAQSEAEEMDDIDPSDISDDDTAPHAQSYASAIRQVPFGDLAEAQRDLPPTKRTGPSRTSRSDAHAEPSEKLQAIRDRLADLKQQKQRSQAKAQKDATQKNTQQDSDSDGDDAPHARSSKHAPAEQSSKHPVTRKRIITEVSANPTHARDPRFSAASGYIDPNIVARRYAFLSDYRADEINELKAAMKTMKDPDEKARLRVAVGRMENRARVDKQREKEAEVVRKHRQEEKERVKQGKKPFFLKNSEVRKQVLVDRFTGMSAKDKDRAVKRRKQKEAQREKRSMPDTRRVRD